MVGERLFEKGEGYGILKGAGGQLKTNVSDRFDAVKLIPNNFTREISTLINGLADLKPGIGVLDTLRMVGDGVIDAGKKQLEITRRWIPQDLKKRLG